MKLMQRIMSRSLLLILILVAGIAYYYRDQLLPGQGEQMAEAGSGSGDADGGAQAPVSKSDQTGTAEPSSSAPAADNKSGESESRTTESNVDSAGQSGTLADVQPPAMQPGRGDNAATGPESGQDSAGQQASAAESPDRSTASDARVQAPVYRTDEASTNQAGSEDLLRQARTAYWSGDMGGAESAYRRALQADPGDPGPAGELGNMLYAQGDYAGAAEAYYQAAVRLLEQGEHQRARHLTRVIAGLDSAKAAQLEEQLSTRGGEDEAGEVK